MAIIEMNKVLLIGLQSEKERILDYLQRTGSIEILDVVEQKEELGLQDMSSSVDSQSRAEAEAELSEVQFALEFISRYNDKKKGLFSGRQSVNAAELEEVMAEKENLLALTKECRQLEGGLAELRTRQTRLHNVIAQMEPWEALDVPLEALADTRRTSILIGTVEGEKGAELEQALKSQYKEVFFARVGSGKEEDYIFLAIYKPLLDEVSAVLKEFGFSKTTFAGLSGTPRQIIMDAKKELEEAEQQRQEIEKQAKGLVSHIGKLEICHDGLMIEVEKQRTTSNLLKTGKTFILRGWVPAEMKDTLTKGVSSITSAFHMDFEEPGEGEVFPVALNNPVLVKPFEMITGLYSTPHSHGIDPNLYMAPFYFAFFGMMVSDAGYGIVLALAAAFFTKKMKPRGGAQKLGWLISLGGVSTFLWGALFGGWFGDLGAQLGIKPLWFDPMAEPLLMLGLCFGLGILQVFVGMGIQAYMNIRKGRILDAVFDQGLWYVFLIGLMLLALEATAGVGKVMAIGGTVGLVLTQGRSQKGIVKKFLSGLLSLYNTTGFLSDVLSYSRLFALGLATGVIAMVINQLGTMLGTSIFGWIVAVLILIGGHIFNILINVLGAFVHASRLQYIEFFGKFFEGGGHAFQPFSKKTKFIDLQEKEAI